MCTAVGTARYLHGLEARTVYGDHTVYSCRLEARTVHGRSGKNAEK